MASLNQCNFIGNVGKIETRYLTNGEAVTNLSLACNETWKNKDGEKQEKCEWVNCTIYRKLAEIAAEYVKVGHQLFISGKMSTRKWEDKEGQTRYTTEIIVNEMKMLGGKKGEDSQESKPSQSAKTAKQQETNAARQGAAFGADPFDSDVPFMWHGARGAGVNWRGM